MTSLKLNLGLVGIIMIIKQQKRDNLILFLTDIVTLTDTSDSFDDLDSSLLSRQDGLELPVIKQLIKLKEKMNKGVE